MRTLLKYGMRGDDVKELQSALNKAINAGLVEDGIFGAKTKTAVKDCQRKNGWKVDGIAGRETLGGLGLLDISDYIIPCEDLKQYTPPLGKTTYGKDPSWGTYKGGACGAVSFSICHRYYKLQPAGEKSIDTILRIGSYAVKNGYRVKNKGTSAGLFGTNGCSYKSISKTATAIEDALRSGCPVILNIGKGYKNGYNGNGHYVVCYGIKGNDFLLRDVGASASSRQKVAISQVGVKLKAAYKIIKK